MFFSFPTKLLKRQVESSCLNTILIHSNALIGNKTKIPFKLDGCEYMMTTALTVHGGFHVAAKIIREPKSHMIPYKFKCSHWLKLQHSDWRAIFHQ